LFALTSLVSACEFLLPSDLDEPPQFGVSGNNLPSKLYLIVTAHKAAHGLVMARLGTLGKWLEGSNAKHIGGERLT
jgi:hypothetical protein